jgi:hypothetical protein
MQMVPVQASRVPSLFEDTENVPVSAPEPAQGERVRTRGAVPVIGEAAILTVPLAVMKQRHHSLWRSLQLSWTLINFHAVTSPPVD